MILWHFKENTFLLGFTSFFFSFLSFFLFFFPLSYLPLIIAQKPLFQEWKWGRHREKGEGEWSSQQSLLHQKK